MKEVERHQGSIRSPRRDAARRGLWGLAIYGGIVAWCLIQLPTAAVFVLPAAVVAVVLHAVRGRPYLAALAFVAVVAVAPALFWPSMFTDVMDNVGSHLP